MPHMPGLLLTASPPQIWQVAPEVNLVTPST